MIKNKHSHQMELEKRKTYTGVASLAGGILLIALSINVISEAYKNEESETEDLKKRPPNVVNEAYPIEKSETEDLEKRPPNPRSHGHRPKT